MKNYKQTIFSLFVIIALVSFSACSKDKDSDEQISGKSSFSMKVNGKAWQSSMTTLMTDEHENNENSRYYVVYIAGVEMTPGKNSNKDDDNIETMGLYVAIPEAKFKNPKGSYPIVLKEIGVNNAWSIFVSTTDIRSASTYVSGDPDNPSKSVGTLEITSFETGKLSILGQSTDKEGYTKLAGKFELDLYPLQGGGSKLSVTDGKFNLTNAFNFDF